METLKNFLASDWGEVRIGKNVYPVRLIVAVGGAALWLGTMLVETGTGGIAAIWTNLLFLIPLVAICSATRTVSLRELVSLCFIGGFMMGVVLLVGPVNPTSSVGRFLMPPLLEESCKISPVLFLLWRWRKSRLWTLAASDVLLMAAASGGGFGLVEDAYIRHRFGWPAQLDWLPVTEIIGGRIIAGHAIWTALAGLTIGLSLLLRNRRPIAAAVAASGFVVSVLDHIANNYGFGSRVGFAGFMNAIAMQGYLVIYLLFLGLVAVLAADLYVVHKTLPRLPELSLPSAVRDFPRKWAFSVQKRALAHAVFNYRRSTGLERAEAITMAALLDAWFKNVYYVYEKVPSSPIPARA